MIPDTATVKMGIILMKLLLNNQIQMTVTLSVLEVVTMKQIMIPLIPMMKKVTTATKKMGIIPMKRILIHMEMRNTVINSITSNNLITNKF
jgi:hypothetical protein